jgi:hypothetical protein
MRFSLQDLHRLKREDSQAYRSQHRAIEALHVEAKTAEGERLRELVIEIESRS